MHNPNDIDWAKIESEFADGWRYWCARGGLDSGTCLDTQGKRRSPSEPAITVLLSLILVALFGAVAALARC